MLSKLLPVILLIVGTAGGIGAGIMLAPEPEMTEEATHGEEGAHAEPEAMEKEEHAEAEMDEAEAHEYIKINNQFVVPVVEREELSSLVVMSLSIETDPGMAEKIATFEPKLRDAFLQVLFDHANMGGFRGAFTRSDVLDPLRTALREEAQRLLGKGVHDVLIGEIVRQDV